MSSDRIVVVGGARATIPTDAINIPLTVGKDGTGYDVKFFGDTSGSYMLWDADTNSLTLVNATLAYTGSFSESYGTSSIPLVLTAGSPLFSVYATCAGVSGSTNAEAVLFNTVMTGAGQVGGRVKINMETNVLLGGWANAFKAAVDCKTVGGSTGLLSVACLEMTLPAGGGRGAYTLLELEATAPSSGYDGGQYGSLIYINASGTTKTEIDDHWVFMHMDAGFTAGAGHLLSATSHTLKVALGALQATTRYLFMSQYEDTISIGLTGAKKSLATGVPEIVVWSTSALTSGTQDVVKIDFTQTAEQQTGYIKGIRCTMTSNVKTPGSFNAIKGIIDYSTNGYAWGDCACLAAELTMPNSVAPRGSYYAIEAQISIGASSNWASAGPLAFCRFQANGTVTEMDRIGYLFDIQGLAEGSDNLVDNDGDAPAATGGIRCRVGTTDIWLLYRDTAPA